MASAGGAESDWTGPMASILAGLASNLLSSQVFAPLMAEPGRADLDALRGLVEAGEVRPVIGRRAPLEEVPAAMRRLGEGHTAPRSPSRTSRGSPR